MTQFQIPLTPVPTMKRKFNQTFARVRRIQHRLNGRLEPLAEALRSLQTSTIETHPSAAVL